MTHEMRLHELPFNQIKDGTKTIESRLNDDKRRLLKVGDVVKFLKRPEMEESAMAKIIGLHVYPTFEELFGSFSPESFGGIAMEDLVESIYRYYSKEDEEKFGVVGIEFQVV